MKLAPKHKEFLHAWLDRLQRLTPGFVRAAIRPLYLKLFYRRVFPEYSLSLEPPPQVDNTLTAWSTYAPFLAYKRQICRNLNLDLQGFGVPCQRGLVSIVLPVYNGERYVAGAIESVLAQTGREFELIVVDDGSTDGTPAILTRYASDPRMRIVRQENRKLPAALNTGFEHARGEFYTWVSADNLLHPHMLATLADFLDRKSTAEMVYADEELIDHRGDRVLPSRSHPCDPGPLNFVPNNYIGGCFLYRAWAAQCVGPYDERCFGFEDYDFWLRMNALFRIAHFSTREVLHSYRIHGESLTAREGELRLAMRTRDALALWQERSRFFAGSFDITFAGAHPWFAALAEAYSGSGHNVFVLDDRSEEKLFEYQVTRAFAKAILISDGVAAGPIAPLATLRDNRLVAPNRQWIAASPDALAYPLLALANSSLWERLQQGTEPVPGNLYSNANEYERG